MWIDERLDRIYGCARCVRSAASKTSKEMEDGEVDASIQCLERNAEKTTDCKHTLRTRDSQQVSCTSAAIRLF